MIPFRGGIKWQNTAVYPSKDKNIIIIFLLVATIKVVKNK